MRNRFFFLGAVMLILVLLGAWAFQLYMQNLSLFTRHRPDVPRNIPRGGDVAVIGGTTAALVAALVAADHGAQVHLFPQGQELGSDTSFLVNEGLATWGAPIQQAWSADHSADHFENSGEAPPGVNEDEAREEVLRPTRESFHRTLHLRGEGMNDPHLLQLFVEQAPALLLWMQDLGIPFDRLPRPEYNPFWLQTSIPQAGQLLREKLLQMLAQRAVFVQEETVAWIELAEEGSQFQALALRNDQEGADLFYVQAVILADGGFSGDLRSWKDFLPEHHLLKLRSDQRGRGLQLAASLQADIVQFGFLSRRIILNSPSQGQQELLARNSWEGLFLINHQGQVLELSRSHEAEAFSFIINAPPDGVFLVAFADSIPVGSNRFTSFDSWDHAVERGWLDRAPGLQLEPPYLLAPVKAGVDYTLGGLSVTPLGEVRRHGEVVPGLYAAGEIAGGLHGEALLEGMPLSESLYLGRAAGQAAATFARR